jgi:hypothetical protein
MLVELEPKISSSCCMSAVAFATNTVPANVVVVEEVAKATNSWRLK